MILSNSEPRIGYTIGHRDSRIVHIITCLKDNCVVVGPPPPLHMHVNVYMCIHARVMVVYMYLCCCVYTYCSDK